MRRRHAIDLPGSGPLFARPLRAEADAPKTAAGAWKTSAPVSGSTSRPSTALFPRPRHCAPDERWHRRLEDETEIAARVLLALQLEAWAIGDGLRQGLGKTEEGPYVPEVVQRFGWVDYGEAMQHGVERLRDQDPREFDNEPFFEEQSGRIPKWNLVSRILFPDLFDSWLNAKRAELHAELTLAILRQRGGEAAPANSRMDSSAVPGAFWTVEPEGDGTRLRFQGPIAEPSRSPLTLDYSLSTADCGRARDS